MSQDAQCELLSVDKLSAAYAIHKASQPRPWSETTFADCLTSPYYALAVAARGEVSGYAIVLEVVDEATLMDIAIAPSARGRGLGKCLLNDVIQRCRAHQMQSLWLEVRAGNLTAIRLYEQAGFAHIETRKAYYPTDTGREDARIMCLSFDAQA